MSDESRYPIEFESRDAQAAHVIKKSEPYRQAQGEISGMIRKSQEWLVTEHQESTRNLAIVSGAIATFSLMLLDSFPGPSLASGISLLLVVVMLCFAHIFARLDRGARAGLMYRKNFLRPMQELAENCMQFVKGKIEFGDWLERDKRFYTADHEALRNELQKLSADSDKLDYTIDVIFALFVVAISLVIYALLKASLASFLAEFLFRVIFAA